MPALDADLQMRLAVLRDQSLLRRLPRVDSPQGVRIRVGERELLNFSSNDYLGLANHPALREAAIQAVEAYGTGSGASRLLSGSLSVHSELEETLADFKNTQGALSFSSGYSTALGTICSVVEKDDLLVLDRLAHACLVDAARLSGAKLRVFRHNDLEDLESKLQWAQSHLRSRHSENRILIVTESVFSMDGDPAPLKEIVALKEQYGAWLMLDEAHATGVFGINGSGRAQQENVANQVEIQMGTLGKALGAAGGYICGSRALIDLLINRARSFIYSTAPVPAAAAAATAAIKLLQTAEGRSLSETLWQRVSQLQSTISSWNSAFRILRPALQSPIVPIILGDEQAALEAAATLREQGFFVPAIRFPTVARGSARLRITLTADHSEHDVERLGEALRSQIVNSR